MNNKKYKEDIDTVYGIIPIVKQVLKDYKYDKFCLSLRLVNDREYSYFHGDDAIESEFYFKLIRKLID